MSDLTDRESQLLAVMSRRGFSGRPSFWARQLNVDWSGESPDWKYSPCDWCPVDPPPEGSGRFLFRVPRSSTEKVHRVLKKLRERGLVISVSFFGRKRDWMVKPEGWDERTD